MHTDQILKLIFILVLSFCSFFFNPSEAIAEVTEDYILVLKNNTIMFDAITEEEDFNNINKIELKKEPQLGKLKVNGDNTFTFDPNPDVCEETDAFVYCVHKIDKVDTVSVKLDILCEKLTFMSGFSPNGDGINDTYTIVGVEAFPKNSLVVFNKWGEEVFATKGYDNSWDGRDKSGDLLASQDNVYYYVFNDGEELTFSGYLKIE